jgi:hypothetical protein
MVVDAPSNVRLGSEEANFNLFGNFCYSPLAALENASLTISGLQGMGGVGKTALALKLAEKIKAQWEGQCDNRQ